MGCDKGVYGFVCEFMVHRPYLLEFTAQGSLLLAVNSQTSHEMEFKSTTTLEGNCFKAIQVFGHHTDSFGEFTAQRPFSLGVYGRKLPWEGVYGVFKSLN